MSDGPGREEFTAAIDRLDESIRDGFEGTHRRLDAINGRVGRAEIEQARQDQRLKVLEHAVFPRRRRDDPDEADYVSERTRERRKIARDTGLVAVAFAALGFGFKLLLMLGEFIIGLAKTALKVP